MGFLAPGFLLGALAVALPLYLHLLRRQGSPPQPFSSLMFFEPREQSAMRRRRLRYWLLLALRLAVVLLLAAAFAEPYIPRLTAGAAPDKLMVLVIDRSLSMRAGSRLAQAKREALAVLARKRSGDSAQVLTLGSQVSALTQATRDPSALRAAVQSVEPSDSHGSFGALAAAMRSIAATARTPIELHLFSDLKRTSMPPSFAEMALPPQVTLVLHPLAAAAEPNWAVESVAVPGEVWNPRATRVRAVIAGYATPAARKTVSLLINGRTVATQQVQVPASGRAAVEFTSLEVPHGLSRCAVRIDSSDALPADDEYRFAVERSDPKRGLFIHQSSDERSPLYFGTALASAAPAAFQLEKLPVDRAASLDPQGYAFVVLSDVASLPDTLADRLSEYVRRGGGILISLGTAAAQQRAVPLFGGELHGTHTYSREAQRFASVGVADSTYPSVGQPMQWDGVRFFFAANVDVSGSRVALRLSDGVPLLAERALGEGRVVLFASGFDNLTNDLPLHPVFVAFVDRTIRYLTGTEARSSSSTVDEFVALRAAREQGVGVEVVDPQGRRALSLASAASAQWLQLAQAGFYELRLANGRRDLIAANPDRLESDLTPIPPEVLALWRGGAGANAAADAAATPQQGEPAARSLWWYAMVLLLVAALAESALGSRYLGTLREHP
ncbi:MAG TPA: BatA domain-containing protein [Steroidobacteraceae bacterium]|nr:BatA domain-containing protein [Steroidobacteraceae bacterium]